MPDSLQAPPASPKRRGAPPQFLFTRESAQAAAAISHANRKAKAQRIADLVEEALAASNASDFPSVRLLHVRTELLRIDELSKATTDDAKLKNFAQATRLLQEQERQLAGRPLPARGDSRRRPEPPPPRPPCEPLPG